MRLPTAVDPARRLAAIVLGFTLLRLAVAGLVGLGLDEAYAVVMGRHLSLSYFDHPPMVFWWAGLAARLAHSESAFAVRLPFVAAFALTSWLVFRLAALLFGRSIGVRAALLANLSLFFSVAAGGWVLPDGPLLLFSAAAAYCLARATGAAGAPAAGGGRGWWGGFGLCAGLALLSKYHAVFLLAGAGVYLATSRQRAHWLRRPEPWLAVLAAGLVFLPVLAWNASHGWASFRFQGGRAVPGPEGGGTPLLDSLAGQAVWILPWIWLPLVVALLSALRRGPGDPRRWLLVCLGAGPVFGFTLLAALGVRGMAHWSAPGYFLLLPLLAAAAERDGGERRWARPWLAGCAVAFAAVVLALGLHARTGWLRPLFARDDPTDKLVDWTPVARQIRGLGYPAADVLVAGARWDDTAKLALALGPSVEVGCVGEDARGFALVGDPSAALGRDVLLAVRRRPGPEPLAAYAGFFDGLRTVGSVRLERRGREQATVSLYLGHRLRATLPALQRR